MKILKLTLMFVVVLGTIAGGFFLMTKTESDPLPQIKCDYCNKTFTDEAEYKDHLHSEHLSFVCDHCSERFESQDRLDDHLDTEHLKYACDKCDMKFISEDELKKHKDDVHKRTVKAPTQPKPKFKCRCPGCDMTFSSETARYNHELSAHLDKLYKCPYFQGCGYYNFTGEDALNTHLKHTHND